MTLDEKERKTFCRLEAQTKQPSQHHIESLFDTPITATPLRPAPPQNESCRQSHGRRVRFLNPHNNTSHLTNAPVAVGYVYINRIQTVEYQITCRYLLSPSVQVVHFLLFPVPSFGWEECQHQATTDRVRNIIPNITKSGNVKEKPKKGKPKPQPQPKQGKPKRESRIRT